MNMILPMVVIGWAGLVIYAWTFLDRIQFPIGLSPGGVARWSRYKKINSWPGWIIYSWNFLDRINFL
jgi:hypothetical protein